MRRPTAWGLSASMLVAILCVAAPASGAPSCVVRNTDLGARYWGSGRNLQVAISEATTGDTLVVKGTCVGHFSIGGNRALTLRGRGSERFPFQPVLDADGAGRTLAVRHARVRLEQLILTGGETLRSGGGIFVRDGVVVLTDTTWVIGNHAVSGGGGISNYGGTVLLRDGAAVVHNRTGGPGGGIENRRGGTVVLADDAAVLRNRAGTYDGGGIDNAAGTVRLLDRSLVARNRSADAGGGIDTSDTLVLADRAAVRHNEASGFGGGIHISRGADVTLRGSVDVRHNLARAGGGVMIRHRSTLTLRNESSIVGNTALETGGGIGVRSHSGQATVFVCSARVAISPNDPEDPPPTLPCGG